MSRGVNDGPILRVVDIVLYIGTEAEDVPVAAYIWDIALHDREWMSVAGLEPRRVH